MGSFRGANRIGLMGLIGRMSNKDNSRKEESVGAPLIANKKPSNPTLSTLFRLSTL